MNKTLQHLGPVCAVVGSQWGDEGKGKLVDILAGEYDIVARATGGANAGHTIYVGGKKFVAHLIPSGMLHPKARCVMGNGMVVHLPTLIEEMEVLDKAGIKVDGRLVISDRLHITFDYHKLIDGLQEKRKGKNKVGTTGRGIGPCYTDKIGRFGIQMGEVLDEKRFAAHYRENLERLQKMYRFKHDGEAELKELKKAIKRLAPLVTDTSLYLAQALAKGKTILLEGANGTMLDIDHGTYPYVTSSNATVGGIITGTGLPPMALTSAVGIVKAYTTRVGSGPFPSELDNALGESIRQAGGEFGATTGRPRRCGWFDTVAVKYAVRVNGLTALNLTKVDVLSGLDMLKIGVGYMYKGELLKEMPSDREILENCTVVYREVSGWKEDITGITDFTKLPKACQKYIEALEKYVGCPMRFIGTGPNREQMIVR